MEMLSASLEGSELFVQQNEHLRARMSNEVLWGAAAAELEREYLAQRGNGGGEGGGGEGAVQYLYGVTELSIDLDIYTLPFTLLPESTVEVPGNALVSALIARMLPAFLSNVVRDWEVFAGRRRPEDASSQGADVADTWEENFE